MAQVGKFMLDKIVSIFVFAVFMTVVVSAAIVWKTTGGLDFGGWQHQIQSSPLSFFDWVVIGAVMFIVSAFIVLLIIVSVRRHQR